MMMMVIMMMMMMGLLLDSRFVRFSMSNYSIAATARGIVKVNDVEPCKCTPTYGWKESVFVSIQHYIKKRCHSSAHCWMPSCKNHPLTSSQRASAEGGIRRFNNICKFMTIKSQFYENKDFITLWNYGTKT